jgi:hypothetical protein
LNSNPLLNSIEEEKKKREKARKEAAELSNDIPTP